MPPTPAPTINAIVDAIATTLVVIPMLNVSRYFPGSITPPIAIVGVPPVTSYHTTMQRGTITLEPTITVFVGSASDVDGQKLLTQYVDSAGTYSIRAAIEADKTLGGVVSNCIVREFRPLNLEEYAALQYFGGVFTLELYARGKATP